MSFRTQAIGVVCAGCVFASGYFFRDRSRINLDEVQPKLQEVAQCALNHSPVDFVVVDGGRTAKEHAINVANGKSWTKRSRHQDGAAIDFAAWVDDTVTYEPIYYLRIASAFKACSLGLKIPIVWGGDWKVKDMMHIELDRKVYP